MSYAAIGGCGDDKPVGWASLWKRALSGHSVIGQRFRMT
jgi:hypothetical protein